MSNHTSTLANIARCHHAAADPSGGACGRAPLANYCQASAPSYGLSRVQLSTGSTPFRRFILKPIRQVPLLPAVSLSLKVGSNFIMTEEVHRVSWPSGSSCTYFQVISVLYTCVLQGVVFATWMQETAYWHNHTKDIYRQAWYCHTNNPTRLKESWLHCQKQNHVHLDLRLPLSSSSPSARRLLFP